MEKRLLHTPAWGPNSIAVPPIHFAVLPTILHPLPVSPLDIEDQKIELDSVIL